MKLHTSWTALCKGTKGDVEDYGFVLCRHNPSCTAQQRPDVGKMEPSDCASEQLTSRIREMNRTPAAFRANVEPHHATPANHPGLFLRSSNKRQCPPELCKGVWPQPKTELKSKVLVVNWNAVLLAKSKCLLAFLESCLRKSFRLCERLGCW